MKLTGLLVRIFVVLAVSTTLSVNPGISQFANADSATNFASENTSLGGQAVPVSTAPLAGRIYSLVTGLSQSFVNKTYEVARPWVELLGGSEMRYRKGVGSSEEAAASRAIMATPVVSTSTIRRGVPVQGTAAGSDLQVRVSTSRAATALATSTSDYVRRAELSSIYDQLATLRRNTFSVSGTTGNVIERIIVRESQTVPSAASLDSSSVAKLQAELNALRSYVTTQNDGLYRAISLTNKIDNLPNVTIVNPTITNNTGGSAITGLKASDIPTDIVASNYLPLAGGALTGTLTVTGDLSVTGTTTFSGQPIQFPSGAGIDGNVLTTDGAGVMRWASPSAASQSPWGTNINAAFYSLSSALGVSATNVTATDTVSALHLLATGSTTLQDFTAVNATTSALVVSGNTTLGGTLGVTGNVTLSGVANSVGTITSGVWNGTAIAVGKGGTGLTSAPTYGQVLVGNSTGGYTLMATSSLAIESFSTTSAQHFVNSSSTIPKTYSNNTFTGTQAFGNITASGATTTNLSVSGTASATDLYVSGNIHLPLYGNSSVGVIYAGPFQVFSIVGTFNPSTFVGYAAGNLSSTGSDNVGVGEYSLNNVTTGSANVAVGGSSLWSNTTGSANVALGQQALSLNTSGHSNIAVGYDTLGFNVSGTFNTAVGNLALQQATSATNVVAIGAYALNHNSSDNLVAVGTMALAANDYGIQNTAVGHYSLYQNSTGNDNTTLGFKGLYTNSTGYGNTAVGRSAMYYNTTGYNNTALGATSLYSNTLGARNTAVGLSAMAYNTTGSSSAAFGSGALFANTTGDENTAVGWRAMMNNTTGAYNVALGTYAGDDSNSLNYNKTGSYNTFLGYKASQGVGFATVLTNATAIGANALVDSSNSMVLGGTGAYAVNVGIGTTSPFSKLSVAGAGWFDGGVSAPSISTQSVTSTSTELVLSQTSDDFGATSLRLQNRQGSAGALFTNSGLDLVDFGFLPNSSVQSNLRWEHRGSSVSALNPEGEFQFIESASGIKWLQSGKGATILSTGNMGIGTTSPYAKLSVVGEVVSSYFTATSTTATSTFSNGLAITGGCLSVNGTCLSVVDSSFSTTSAQYFVNSSTTIPKTYDTNIFTGAQVFDSITRSTTTEATTTYLSVSSHASTSALSVDGNMNVGSGNLFVNASNGYVGIGTQNPLAKLHFYNTTASNGFLYDVDNVANNQEVFIVRSTGTGALLQLRQGGTIDTASVKFSVDYEGNTVVNGNTTLNGTLGAGTTTVTNLIVSNTSTSTFAGGVQTTALNITGNATTTFANGIQLTTGCFMLPSGQCAGTGAGGGGDAYLANSQTFSGHNIFNSFFATNASTTNATTTNLTVTGTAGDGTDVNRILYLDANGLVRSLAKGGVGTVLKMSDANSISWGVDNSGSGGGAGLWATTSVDELIIAPTTPSQVVVVGKTTTTTDGNYQFEVGGTNRALIPYSSSTAVTIGNADITQATTTYLSVGTHASTSALTVSGNTTFSAYGAGIAALNSAGALYSVASSSIFGFTPASSQITKGFFMVGDDSGVAQATSSVFVSSIGSVGVGTTTPNNKLDIYSTTKAAIGFSGASGSTYKWTMGMDVSDAGKFKISSSTALNTSDRFVINGNGYVGIGTANPSSQLEVVGDIVSKGTAWTSRTAAEANNWRSVTYGNGMFVAVGEGGIMTSSDGVNWTSRTVAEANTWRSVTYGNGLFVAVSINGTNRVVTSTDGITWTSRTAAEANQWTSVTYGNGIFVAVAETGTNRVMTSPDGTNWTSRSASAANNWMSVVYGNGTFVAVGAPDADTNSAMTSLDGISWVARTPSALRIWESVAYGNGIFVAVSSSATTNIVMTSPDGSTWTARTAAEANQWTSVTYGNGIFVAISLSGTNRVMTSPNGISWTARSATEANEWMSVTYGNGLFVAVSGSGTNRVMTSGKMETNALAHNNIYQGLTSFSGNVGVGTTSPNWLFSVAGNGWLTGTFTATNLTATGTLTAANLALSGSTTLQNFTAVNATTSQATTTYLSVGTHASTSALTVSGNITMGSSAGNNGEILWKNYSGIQQWTATSSLGFATRGANSDITSLSGLTTALSVGQGGTGLSSAGTYGGILVSNGSGFSLMSTSSLAIEAWSTTSASNWLTTIDKWSTTSASWYTGSSSTIPKTYSANTFTALNDFSNASSTLFSVNGQFWAGGTSTTTITSAGLMGIGTSTPYSKLTLWSDTTNTGKAVFELVDSASTTVFTVNDRGTASTTNVTIDKLLVLNSVGTTTGAIRIKGAAGYYSYITSPNETSFYAGLGSGNPTTTTGYNVGVGPGVLTAAASTSMTSTGSGNTATGYGAMNLLWNGSHNSAFGYASMIGLNGVYTGDDNSAFGSLSLSNITSGNYNTAVGKYTLHENTTGGYNTAIGGGALYSNVDGARNVAVGSSALPENVSGVENVAIGDSALYWNGYSDGLGGSANTAIGFMAGAGNISWLPGSNNTFLGSYSDAQSESLSNATAIGYMSTVGASNSIALGGVGAYSVNVGISTSTPYSKLSIWSNATNAGARVLEIVDQASSTQFFVTDRGHASTSALTVSGNITMGSSAGNNGEILWKNYSGIQQWTATSSLGFATRGANSDITSLSGLTTALSVGQGGTGLSSAGTYGGILVSNGSGFSLMSTSSLAIESFSTTSADYWGTTKGYITSAASTTLEDTNTWTGGNTFANASSTNMYTSSTLTVGGNATTTNDGWVDVVGGYKIGGASITGFFATTTAANTWTAHNIFSSLFATEASTTNATTTYLSVGTHASTSALTVSGNATLSSLATAAGTFLAVDVNGLVISTTTPAGGGSGAVSSGLAGQFAFYESEGTTVKGTSTLFVSSNSNVGIGTTTPLGLLHLWKNAVAPTNTLWPTNHTTLLFEGSLEGGGGSPGFAMLSSGNSAVAGPYVDLSMASTALGVVDRWVIGRDGYQGQFYIASSTDQLNPHASNKIFTISGVLGNVGISTNLNVTGNITANSLNLTPLALPAGQFLAVDMNGAVIGTTTPAGGGAPGGSDNQIQYKNGSSFAGASNLTYDGNLLMLNNARFGLGTTTPKNEFHVFGSAAATTTADGGHYQEGHTMMILEGDYQAAPGIGLLSRDSSNNKLGYVDFAAVDSTGSFIDRWVVGRNGYQGDFYIATTTNHNNPHEGQIRAFTISGTNGYVGIGTNETPEYNLDVSGSGRFTGQVTVNSLKMTSVAAAGVIPFVNPAGVITADPSLITLNLDTQRFAIGTTTPNQKFSLYGDVTGGPVAMEFSGAANDTYKWTMGMLAAAGGGKFVVASSSDLTSPRFIIDGNGDVTIGGNIVGGNGLDITNMITTGGLTVGSAFTVNSPVNANLLGGASTTVLSVSGSLWVGGNATTTSNGNITTNGSLAVGTSTAYSKFLVWGNATSSGRAVEVTDSASTTLFSIDNTGSTTITNLVTGSMVSDNDAGFMSIFDMPVASTTSAVGTEYSASIGINGSSTLTVYAQKSSILAASTYLDAVGVGTTSPSAKFAISGNTTNDTGRLLAFADYANNERLTMLTNGKLGLGTTSPNWLLSVNGNGWFTGTLTATNITATGTASSTSLIVSGWATTSALAITGNATSTAVNGLNITDGCYAIDGDCIGLPLAGSEGQMAYFSGANTAVGTSTLFVSTESKVGIGTTTPFGLLNISSNDQSYPQLVLGDMTQGEPNAKNWYIHSVGGNLQLGLLINGYNLTPQVNIGGDGTVIAGQFITPAEGRAAQFLAGASVGTSSPYADLTVWGTSATSRVFEVVDSASTTLFSIDSSGTTTISSLNVGTMQFETDAGVISWANLPTATTTAGMALGYSAQIADNDMITLFASTTATAGVVTNRMVVIGPMPSFAASQSIANDSLVITNGALCVDDGGDNCDDGARDAGHIYTAHGSFTAMDVAENYPTKEATSTVDVGSVLMVDYENAVFVKRYDGNSSTTPVLVGVVSTDPGVLLGGFDMKLYPEYSKVPVALSGRVPVKVNLDGGEIKIGDYLAPSYSEPGVAAKATTTGQTLGIALEAYNGEEEKEGKIVVFVNLGYQKISSGIANGEMEGGWAVDAETGLVKMTTAAGLDMQDKDITNVRKILSKSGKWSIDEEGNLKVQNLIVGSADAPAGITIYDRATGEPYCFYVENGASKTSSGVCGTVPAPSAPASSPSGSQSTPSSLDTEAPVIEIIGNNPALLNIGDSYSDNGATITDNIDQNLGVQTTGLETVDTATAGTYYVKYNGTDNAGNNAVEKVREVIVTDPNVIAAPPAPADEQAVESVPEPVEAPAETPTESSVPAETPTEPATTTPEVPSTP